MRGTESILMVAAGLGAVALWLMLPPRRLRGRMAGAAAGAAALGLLASQTPRIGPWLADGLFFLLAGVTVVAAAATVTLRNPVYSAIWFGLSLLGTAGLLLFQGAQFLAVATVVVYAGAILVTFLFVLMLANPSGRDPYDRASWEPLVSAASGAVIVGVLSIAVGRTLAAPGGLAARGGAAGGPVDVLGENHVLRLGTELFGRHLIAVEVAGTLLLAALVGAAIIVARHRGPGAEPPKADDSSSPGEGEGDRED